MVFDRFAEAYFHTTRPFTYGAGVVKVFTALRDASYLGDPYEPAKKQFNGMGSYGNGAAMRVYPAALFHYGDKASCEKVNIATIFILSIFMLNNSS